jgi:hypothetical protein
MAAAALFFDGFFEEEEEEEEGVASSCGLRLSTRQHSTRSISRIQHSSSSPFFKECVEPLKKNIIIIILEIKVSRPRAL